MGISPWQSVCLVLSGAILAVWMDQGNSPPRLVECPSTTTLNYRHAAEDRAKLKALLEDEKNSVEGVDKVAKMAADKWTKVAAATQGTPLNFLRDPHGFIERFQDCVGDPDCHIMYHHVSKTGGVCVKVSTLVVGRSIRILGV